LRSTLRDTLRRLRSDRGASAVEVAILAPVLILVSMLIIQFALWFDATHAALAAAQEGDRVARENAFTNAATYQTAAATIAMNYYHGLNTSVLSNVSVTKVVLDQATNTVSVTVSGRLNGIFPLPVSETVSGPVECFRTNASNGVNCG
jgi:Flp pilus assembly protein TadG